MEVVTRKPAWRPGQQNDDWSDDWLWYAAAIRQMKALTPNLEGFRNAFVMYLNSPLPNGAPDPALEAPMAAIANTWSDPLSLGYQSQVHGTFADRESWPSYEKDGHKAKVLWKECAHDQWFFLPWHRAYLLEFESVVRHHISELDGPADTWALPYWNYSDFDQDPRCLDLPIPLRDPMLPTGVSLPGSGGEGDQQAPNPLFEPLRQISGELPADASRSWALAAPALQRPHYANLQDTAQVSLAGGVIDDPNNQALFHRGGERGQLDAQPHGLTHGHVGGFMWLFETAALDPVFWVHHCNVDRLWETYAHELGHGYPFEGAATPDSAAKDSWFSHDFKFLRPDASVHALHAADMTSIEDLGYRYETTAPPTLPPAAPAPPGAQIDPFGVAPPGEAQPMASAEGVQLDGVTQVMLQTPSDQPAQAGLAAASFPDGTRWLLRFTGVRAALPARTGFDVFLALPAGDVGSDEAQSHYCGGLSLFGAFEATVDDGSSATNGTMQLFDVTEQVRAQGDEFLINQVPVTLAPINSERDLTGLSVEQITIESA